MSDDRRATSNSRRILATIGNAVWKSVLILTWGAWWGGLCFYAIVVVPIGTEAIGSVEQGFITQQVTRWHNLILFVFIALLLIEAVSRRDRILLAMGILLLLTGIGLVFWHVHLSAKMDFQHKTVPTGFYAEHAIYLWLTAVEWFTGLAIPIVATVRIGSTAGTMREQGVKSNL